MFNIISDFEKRVAEFYNAPFAVATDCCTHAIELSLRYNEVREASCPSQTYISVPFTFKKLGIKWHFENNKWNDYYYLGNTNIIDAAVYWKQGGYIPNTFMCLSFQFKKHLNLNKGGMILVSTYGEYLALKKMSYDGRVPDIPWMEQNIDTVGYHYYMTPETAQLGLDRIDDAILNPASQWTYLDYPYLPNMSVFYEKS
jgi:dTDP-4-amino-4,6-dideoxygalactose transaminase